jgi:hypothetical protein
LEIAGGFVCLLVARDLQFQKLSFGLSSSAELRQHTSKNRLAWIKDLDFTTGAFEISIHPPSNSTTAVEIMATELTVQNERAFQVRNIVHQLADMEANTPARNNLTSSSTPSPRAASQSALEKVAGDGIRMLV